MTPRTIYSPIPRRSFLRRVSSVAVVSALAAPALLRSADSPGEKIVLGVMGVNGRGMQLAQGFNSVGGAEISYLCDVDERAMARAVKAVSDKQARVPQGVKDFRRILEDKNVDALVIAAPDHWHAPATIMACAAGKHVYVEKPASHNAREGELMVAADRKSTRLNSSHQ